MIQHDKDGVAQQEVTAAGNFHQPLQRFTQDIAFGDLGSGASDAIALTGIPANIEIHSCRLEIITAFDGEADLACTVGDTGDADELVTSVTIHGLAAGWVATGPGGNLPRMEPDYSTAGADVTFSATELGDVTAGELRVHILYSTPKLSTDA